MASSNPTAIAETHCQQCGSTDAEDVGHSALRAGEGYTACCNELAVYGGCDLYICSHGCKYPRTGESFEMTDCTVHGEAHR